VRTLILGGGGLLGRAVVAEGRRRRYPALALSHALADVTDPERLGYWVAAFRPELIVNCAAFTRVDDCEERRELAFAVNGEAVGTVAAAAAAAGARLLHVSTDYVFDGEAREPYPEAAATAPRSVYGASKLAGEERALAYERALVVRTSWLFGPGGPNFVKMIVGRILGGTRQLRVVDDQVGRPTYAPFLAAALWDLAAAGHPRPGAGGVLHYGNREPISWYGFAREIAGWIDGSVEVEPVTTAEFPRPANRPAYSVLDVSRAEALLGRPVEPWGWGLAEYLTELRRQARRQGGRG
jgi:dTDP-4-dehydrorhamnose reductase